MTENELNPNQKNRIVVRNAVDLALTWPKIIFALQTILLWSLVNSLFSLSPVLFAPLTLIWSLACLNAFGGGIARIVALEFEGKNEKILFQTWSFVRRYCLDLIFGSWIVGLTALAISIVAIGLIQLLTKLPLIGQFLGQILIVPMFLLVFVAISLYINTYLLPTIMGLDGCSALNASKKLLHVSLTQPFQLIMGYLSTIASILPIALLSGILTGLSLSISLSICRGQQMVESLMDSFSYDMGFFERLSVSPIGFSWLAFLGVFVATSFSILYHNASEIE